MNVKENDMKRKLIALLFAMAMVLSTGCSDYVSSYTGTGPVLADEASVDETRSEAAADASDEAAAKDEAEKEDGVGEYSGGLRIRYPDAFLNAKGQMNIGSYEIEYDSGVYITYFTYIGASKDWLEEHLDVDEPTSEDIEKYKRSKVDLAYIFTIDDNRGLDDLVEIVKNADDTFDFDEEDYTQIAGVDDCTFYRVTKLDKIGSENLEDEFREEFDTLYDMFDDVLADAGYFKPVSPYNDLIGKKVEFTTTDIDGNPVTSDEIFSQNEVTMVNVWATWCHWCIVELPELNEINDRLNQKNCAVVGIVGDGTDEDIIAEAKKLLKENGDEYLNILPWEDALTDDFPMLEGWPTTFFVDKEGRIAVKPVVGADTKRYEKVVEEILAGEKTETQESEQAKVSSNDMKQYRIYVSDTEGNPVKGAKVQLCDDSTCMIENTDKSGLAVFSVKKSEYTVHILDLPEGYKKDDQEYKLPAEYSDLNIKI